MREKGFDPVLFVLAMLASLIGIAAIWDSATYRAAASGELFPADVWKQVIFLGVGVMFAIALSRTSEKVWRNVAWPLLILSVVGLLAVKFTPLGHTVSGGERWLRFAGITIQPSEFAKIAVIVYFAGVLAFRKVVELPKSASLGERLDNKFVPGLKLGFAFLLVMGIAFMIERQPDLDTAMVIVLTAFGIMFSSGMRATRLLMLVGIVGILAFGAVSMTGFRLERFTTHANRWAPENINDSGFQPTQSEAAMAAGGIFGQGLGEGVAKERLPAPTTDFILTTISEELGLIGSLAVLLLLGLIVWRLLALSRGQSLYGRLILVGTAVWVGAQTCVNYMMASALLPPIGIPLPFISAGGSSLLALWLMLGISQGALNGAQEKEEKPEARRNRRRNRRSRLSRA